jgi:hypothetical protein
MNREPCIEIAIGMVSSRGRNDRGGNFLTRNKGRISRRTLTLGRGSGAEELSNGENLEKRWKTHGPDREKAMKIGVSWLF